MDRQGSAWRVAEQKVPGTIGDDRAVGMRAGGRSLDREAGRPAALLRLRGHMGIQRDAEHVALDRVAQVDGPTPVRSARGRVLENRWYSGHARTLQPYPAASRRSIL